MRSQRLEFVREYTILSFLKMLIALTTCMGREEEGEVL